MGDRSSQLSDLDMLETLGRQLANEEYLARAHMYRADYLYATGDFVAPSNLWNMSQVILLSFQMNCWAFTSPGPIRFSGWVGWRRALQHAKEGLTLMRLSGRRLEEGRMLSSMGLIAIDQNEPETAREYLIEAVRIARELQILDLEGKALNNLANVAGFILSDFALARDYYEQAFSIFHERGDYYGEGLITSNLGWCAGMQGEFDAAMTALKQALLIAREVGNAYQETYNLINLSVVSGIQGEFILAMQYASQAYDMSLKVIDHSSQAWAYLYLGHANLLVVNGRKPSRSIVNRSVFAMSSKQFSLAMGPDSRLDPAHSAGMLCHLPLNHPETILEYLAAADLEGTEEPLRIYYACYSALKETKDPRANDALDSCDPFT